MVNKRQKLMIWGGESYSKGINKTESFFFKH